MKKKFNYSWIIIGLSALMVCVVLGFCSSSKGMYIKAITETLGISRSTFSINDSCRFVTTSIINLFFGYLVGKFGAKKLISAGFICLIASMLIYSYATNVFVFYIGGALLGIGLSWTTTTMVGYVVNRWCRESKGTIMGAVLATNGIGAAVATQIMSPIIHSSALGYQQAYRLIALILLAVFVLILLFFKNNSKNADDAPVAATKKKGRGESWVGVEYSDVVKKAYFYMALVGVFFTGMMLQGISGISTAHQYDVGIDVEYVATVISVHSIALTVFKLLVGYIYDKSGLRTTANICMVTAVAVFVLLANVSNTATGMVFSMIYSIFSSLALPLETIMLPIYAADLFGEKSFNKILGLVVSVNTAGYALGAPISNLSYDLFGSYVPVIYISAVLMVGVMVLMNIVITIANRNRNRILAESKGE